MILLDATVLLEMILKGRSQQQKVIDWMEKNEQDFCISMLTVHMVLHFGLRDALTQQELVSFLADYPKLPLLPEDYVNAMKLLKNRDHEDALQLATAQRVGCSAIVTLDQSFATLYADRIRFINPSL